MSRILSLIELTAKKKFWRLQRIARPLVLKQAWLEPQKTKTKTLMVLKQAWLEPHNAAPGS